MAPSRYFTKYTLRDYISMKGKEASPPAPTSFDYLKAEMKEAKLKGIPQLSAEAPPFCSKDSSISVSSLMSPNQTFQVPVQSSFLPLSTLRQYFPLATGLHYITDQQMITLATSNNFIMREDCVELSHQKFHIPFLGTEITYLVTEDSDLLKNEECESVLDNIVNFAMNIHDKMGSNLAEFMIMKDLVVQIQSQLKNKVSLKMTSLVNPESILYIEGKMGEPVGDGLETVFVVENAGEDNHTSREDCLVQNGAPNVDEREGDSSKKLNEDEFETAEDLLYNKIKIYADDYGFSDTEDEKDDSDMFTRINSVLYQNEDKKPSSTLHLQHFDTRSVSCRPKCVKRILGN